MGRMAYFLHKNVFASYVKILEYFHTDKISLESTFHWLSEDTVKFAVDVVVCAKFAKM